MKKEKKAIVTLTIGENHIRNWTKICKPNWKKYAEKFDYEILVFNKPLDNSVRAQKRSPAWQKCLVLDQEPVKGYDRVVWIDSDIIINSHVSSDIISGVPESKIGATDGYSFYTKNFYSTLLDSLEKNWKNKGINSVLNKTPNSFYTQYGFSTDLDDVIQTGVMVLKPGIHNDLLRHVYESYEDKGGSEWNYEMRPLSYEVVKNNYHHFIDERFNFLFSNFKIAFYPHLHNSTNSFAKKGLRKIGIDIFNKEIRIAVSVAYMNSFFLHFAGCNYEMQYFNPRYYQHSQFL